MTKHSKTPWKSEDRGSIEKGAICWTIRTGDDGNYLADIEGSDVPALISRGWRPIEEAEADVRLIVAAPDLLAACLTLTEMCKRLGFDTASMPGFEKTAYEAGLAAIAKAEGRKEA